MESTSDEVEDEEKASEVVIEELFLPNFREATLNARPRLSASRSTDEVTAGNSSDL